MRKSHQRYERTVEGHKGVFHDCWFEYKEKKDKIHKLRVKSA